MEPIQTGLVKAGADAAVEAAKGFLQKLVGPALEEAGLLLQDQVRVFRFKNQLRILAKAERMLADANRTPDAIPLKVLAPLLEHASLEDDTELQDRWAALIANAAVGDNIQPLFGDMLGRLFGREARLLDGLFEKVHECVTKMAGPGADALGHVHDINLGDWIDLIRVYVVRGIARPDLVSVDWVQHFADPGCREVYRDFGITLDKLLREAILWRKQVPAMDGVARNYYIMTVVGYEFIDSCRQPQHTGKATSA